MKYENRGHIIFNTVRITFVFLCCLTAGYALSLLLFWTFGTPSSFFSHMISACLGVLLFVCLAKIMSAVLLKGHNEGRMAMLNQTVEAMDRIAHGDFNISVETYDHDPFFEVAESINKMATELGALETMRQDFISNVSHEIQSPLTSIGGFAALLKKDDLPNEQRQKYAEIIETESKRLSSLSDNLLKLSSLDNNKIPLMVQAIRLDKQLENITLALEPQWSAKNLEVEADLNKCEISCDEDLLSQVWMNLLHNAIKFTPEGGQINVVLSSDEKGAKIKISDTGVGIASEDQIHIFERFYKADKARDRSLGGNGLGLSLVKKIVELHGGEITVKSEIGKGTIFEVVLPHQNTNGE